MTRRETERTVRQRPATPSPAPRSLCVPSTIRIAILSDSALFRSGLRRLLGTDRSFSVVGEITEPPVRNLVRSSSPHILLVDAQVTGALTVCRELRQNGARPWAILAGVDGDEAWAARALETGARGILARNATEDNLIKAVRVVHQGQVWASNRVITLTIEHFVVRSVSRAGGAMIPGPLSPREEEIVRLIATGLSNLEAAGRLGITEATVKAHLTRIFQKLSVRSRGQLAARYHAGVLARCEPRALPA
ncbi:MAG TPA: response regulator transcription factor [Methylomirabilota bacterium]|nr:response regulator transcription factor [Methylomirabilota bacterium]